MSTKAIDDYLTKQIVVSKNIVTCRSLSRALSLQVNVAKNELHEYFQKAKTRQDTLSATYRLTGIPKQSASEDMDVDSKTSGADGYDDADAEYVNDLKSTLVPEEQLLVAQEQYTKIQSLYIYALSPSPVKDCALVCNSDSVRQADRANGDDFAKTVGKIVGENIKVIPQKLKKVAKPPPKEPVAGPSKTKDDEPKKGTKDKPEAPAKKVATGKLDFSKAKPKAANVLKDDAKESMKGKLTSKAPAGFFKLEKKETSIPSRKSKAADTDEDSAPTAKVKPEKKADTKTVSKKGKSALMSESEAEDPQPSKAKAAKKVEKTVPAKKGNKSALLSETESDATPAPKAKATKKEEPKASAKRKSMAADSEREDSDAKASQKRRLSKRKSPVPDSDDEDSRPPAKKKAQDSKQGAQTELKQSKSKVAQSDDEDSDGPVVRRKKTRKNVVEEHDSDLEAMMAMDDDDVIRATREGEKLAAQDGEEENAEEHESSVEDKQDDDMDVDVAPAPKKKRKAKVVVPVGKNGLKKKRVTKTRTVTDAKGYEGTEDYSSWESVSEDEEPAAPKKSQAKAKAKPKPKAKVAEDSDAEAPTPKPKAKPAAKVVKKESEASETKTKPVKKAPAKKGQQNIASFFKKT